MVNKPKVFIAQRDCSVSTMFREAGWSIVSLIEEADLIQFTGGADINPALYGQEKHNTTHYNPERDILEKAIYNKGLELGKAFAGICRGGQFLNVMNGGTLYQNVDNHRRPHTIVCITKDPNNRLAIDATSTHHQMMRPTKDAKILAFALESSQRISMIEGTEITELRQAGSPDYEVLFYPKTKSLCFQPHPEHLATASKELKDYYFQLIKEELGICVES